MQSLPNTRIDTHIFDLNGHEINIYRYWDVSIDAGASPFVVVHRKCGDVLERIACTTIKEANKVFAEQIVEGHKIKDAEIVDFILKMNNTALRGAIKADLVAMQNDRRRGDSAIFLSNRIDRMIAQAKSEHEFHLI